MSDTPMFSRSGNSSHEKLDARIDIPASESLQEKLIALAVMHRRPKAEYARMLLTKAVEGGLAWLQSMGQLPPGVDGTNEGGTR